MPDDLQKNSENGNKEDSNEYDKNIFCVPRQVMH